MKKVLIPGIGIILSLAVCTNVHACGDLYNLSVDKGTLSRIDKYHYKVALDDNSDSVIVDAGTTSSFVNSYGPRRVDTNKDAILMTTGTDCKNDNIYTYTITFEKKEVVADAESTGESTESSANPSVFDAIKNKAPNTAFLKNLVIDGYDLNFNKDVDNYSLTVKRNVKSLNIIATPEKETTGVTISDNAKNLTDETNIVTITLVDPDGTSGVYNIVVSKEQEKSDNNRLKSLTIEGYTLNFDPAKTNYNLTINNEKALAVNAETQSDKASFEVLGNENLKNGSTITIKVTAENGDTREYKIKVNREFNIMNYWIYILIIVLIIILIVAVRKGKKDKNKPKKSAPSTIETKKDTAGKAGEMFNTEDAEAKKEEEPKKKGNLQIIKPDYTGTIKNEDGSVSNKTEVFKL